MSSSNPYQHTPNQPPPPPPRSPSSNTGLIIGIVAAVVAVPMLLVCIGVLVGLLLPAVQAAREAARRMQCSNNEKQIVLALLNYESTYQALPPAFTVDANGQPLHSWRTLILPFMEQQALYSQIDLTKPWDDPVNIGFSEMDIPSYRCPSTPLEPGMTTYVAVVDPRGVFSGSQATQYRSIVDGTSNTLLVVETDVANSVNWMSPNDIDLTTFANAGADPTAHTGGSNCAFCDGSVQFISSEVDPTSRERLIIKDDSREE